MKKHTLLAIELKSALHTSFMSDGNRAKCIEAVHSYDALKASNVELLEAIKCLLDLGIPDVDDGWKYQRVAAEQKLRRVITKAESL